MAPGTAARPSQLIGDDAGAPGNIRHLEASGRVSRTDFDPRRYWDRRLSRNWSLHGVGQSRLAHSYNRWMYRARRAVFGRVVRSLPVDYGSAHVLDVGCGTGFYVGLWRELGVAHLTGFDIADSAVASLRRRFPDVAFERRDISDAALAEGGERFDVVGAFDILFHIVDDDRHGQAVANVHSLLRPGGWFLFSEHFLHGSRRGVPGGHHVSRTLAEIEDVVRAAGFEIVTRRPMLFLMAWPVDSTARWRRRLWKRMVPLMASERWGNLLGAALYPFDFALSRVLAESPTVEIMVCRKPG